MLQLTAAGVAGVSFSNWLPVLAARASETRQRTKSCILLWMDGGPSHKDTFDLRPGTDNGGPFQAIDSNVPGIRISEHLPQLAGVMNHAAVIRGMSTAEGAHPRAKYHMHTGYREGQGGVSYPSIGAIAAKEIGNSESPLPNFVSIGNRSYGSGFLGPRHQPLVVVDPTRGVENLRSAVQTTQFNSRLGLLDELESNFHRTHQEGLGIAHRTTVQRAVTLMRDQGAAAFDLTREPSASRSAYGTGRFADSCVLARRLVEAGITFVEVTLGGWDTHQNNFERVRTLSQQVDAGMTQLIKDLHDRGLLDTTLVIWMGEFGRTPRINPQQGRDHFPNAWTAALAGGGIKGGAVFGNTGADGMAVTGGRPVAVNDFIATICRALGMDPEKQNMSNVGRPIRIADVGHTAIREILI
jgi:hypothetical protein